MPKTRKPRAISQAAILERVIGARRRFASSAAAEGILKLDFTPEDHEQMHALSLLAQEGRLSNKEQQEIDNYESVGYLLDLLQSKARLTVRKNGSKVER